MAPLADVAHVTPVPCESFGPSYSAHAHVGNARALLPCRGPVTAERKRRSGPNAQTHFRRRALWDA